MPLTPDQRAAHEELDAAIKKVLELQGVEGDEPMPMLVDWLVVCEGMIYDGEGDSVGYHNVIFRGGQIRRTVALGLLEIGAGLMAPGED